MKTKTWEVRHKESLMFEKLLDIRIDRIYRNNPGVLGYAYSIGHRHYYKLLEYYKREENKLNNKMTFLNFKYKVETTEEEKEKLRIETEKRILKGWIEDGERLNFYQLIDNTDVWNIIAGNIDDYSYGVVRMEVNLHKDDILEIINNLEEQQDDVLSKDIKGEQNETNIR